MKKNLFLDLTFQIKIFILSFGVILSSNLFAQDFNYNALYTYHPNSIVTIKSIDKVLKTKTKQILKFDDKGIIKTKKTVINQKDDIKIIEETFYPIVYSKVLKLKQRYYWDLWQRKEFDEFLDSLPPQYLCDKPIDYSFIKLELKTRIYFLLQYLATNMEDPFIIDRNANKWGDKKYQISNVFWDQIIVPDSVITKEFKDKNDKLKLNIWFVSLKKTSSKSIKTIEYDFFNIEQITYNIPDHLRYRCTQKGILIKNDDRFMDSIQINSAFIIDKFFNLNVGDSLTKYFRNNTTFSSTYNSEYLGNNREFYFPVETIIYNRKENLFDSLNEYNFKFPNIEIVTKETKKSRKFSLVHEIKIYEKIYRNDSTIRKLKESFVIKSKLTRQEIKISQSNNKYFIIKSKQISRKENNIIRCLPRYIGIN